MTTPSRSLDLALIRDDLAYHQARVLLLVTAVVAAQGHSGKVDGLTSSLSSISSCATRPLPRRYSTASTPPIPVST